MFWRSTRLNQVGDDHRRGRSRFRAPYWRWFNRRVLCWPWPRRWNGNRDGSRRRGVSVCWRFAQVLLILSALNFRNLLRFAGTMSSFMVRGGWIGIGWQRRELYRLLLWLGRSTWLLIQLRPFLPSTSSRMLVLRRCQAIEVIGCHEGLFVRSSHRLEAGAAKPQAAIRFHGRGATGRTFLLLGRPAWFLLARAC